MFDNLFVLLGQSGTAIALASALGVVSSVIIADVLRAAFRTPSRRPRLT